MPLGGLANKIWEIVQCNSLNLWAYLEKIYNITFSTPRFVKPFFSIKQLQNTKYNLRPVY